MRSPWYVNSRAEDTIAGVTESWEDVAFFVELAVDGGAVERDVGVLAVEVGDAFRGGDEADELHAFDAGFFEEGNRRGPASAGGEHGVDEEDFGGGDVGGELLVIGDRLEGFFIAIDAEMAEAGVGEQAEDAIGHAQAGTEDGDEGYLAGEGMALHLLERRVNSAGLGGPVTSHLIDHERGDFI